MNDALAAWVRVRASVPWMDLGAVQTPAVGRRDGAVAYFRSLGGARSAGLLKALERLRGDAMAGRPLDFALLAEWQREVLGVAKVPYREGDAFAKRGRERYGVRPREEFDARLAESAPGPVPLASRAARGYLDVCFYHPFADGNARSAC